MIQRHSAPLLVQQVQHELPRPDQYRLSGLIRLAHEQHDLLPRQEISSQLETFNSDEARRQGVALFVGYTAYNAFDDPELAGFATTTRHEDTPNGMHMDRFFVHPTARRRGLGKEIIKEFVNLARERGAPYAQYDPPAASAERHLFESLGFKTSAGKLRLPLAQSILIPQQRLASDAQLLYPSPHGS